MVICPLKFTAKGSGKSLQADISRKTHPKSLILGEEVQQHTHHFIVK